MSKTILTSIHGRKVGLSADGTLVLNTQRGAESVVSQIDGGSLLKVQTAPNELNATGDLTVTMLAGGLVTSTTAAAVDATLPTGAAIDAAIAALSVNDAIYWAVINTGSNAFELQAASGHTIVGSAAVAGGASARFLTRKTAANTFVTYRT